MYSVEKITIGRGEHADVDWYRSGAADPLKFVS